LRFNRCLTAECSEATAHFNGSFDTDNQLYVPYPKCTATFRTHCSKTVISNIILHQQILIVLYHQIITVYRCLHVWIRRWKSMHHQSQCNLNTTYHILARKQTTRLR
jgi:hypothetical protein